MRSQNKYTLCLLACWAIFVSVTFAQHKQDSLPPNLLEEDLNVLRTELESLHPGLYTYTPKLELDAVFDGIKAQLDHPMTALQFFRLLMPLHPAIGNNHTKIYPPQDYVKALTTHLPRFPFRLYWYQDSLFVTEDVSRENQIGPGSQILSINGERALSVFQFLAKQLTTDGYNLSYPYTLTGLGFSRYYGYFKGTPATFQIEYKTPSGIQKEVRVAGIPVPEIMANRQVRIKKMEAKDEFDFQVRNGIGILRLSTFQIDPSSNFTPKAYKTFLKSTFSRLANENIHSLVLDLRDNGGGFPEAANHLLSYLISETVYPSLGEHALVKWYFSATSLQGGDVFQAF